MLKALASPEESDVQIAQAYLRHRPITDERELREVARGIVRMKSPAAQARALETLARHHVSDPQVHDELVGLFTRSTSLPVQRAIAEVFLRAGVPAPKPDLAEILRKHRIKAPGDDLIDTLIRRLGA
jgi:HEAT repeat protein